MKKTRTMCVITVLIAGIMLLSSCSNSGQSQNPSGKASTASGRSVTNVTDTLTVGTTGEPTTLNPLFQNESPSAFQCMQIYETLVFRNNDTNEYYPGLATSWEYLNDTTIRFKLREGVYFHDGSLFTAHDVKYTFDIGKDSKKAYSYVPFDCDATKVVDDYTIDIVTKGPFPAVFDYLVGNPMLIISKKAVESAPSLDEYGRNPIGTGPWVFKEWIAGDRIVYERNENYWGEKVVFSKMVIRNIPDDTTRALSLEAGEIDVSILVVPSQCKNLESNPDVELVRFPSFVNHYIGINVTKGPLSDVRVRKALRYAFDQEAITDIAYAGTGVVSDSVYTKALSCYSPPSPETTYTYDVEEAKALLKEAGYPDGFKINLWVNENQARIDMAEMLQNAWGAIGIETNVEVMEFGAYLEKIHAGEHDLFILGFTSGGNDGAFAREMFYTEPGTFNNNTQGYSNPRYDELADLAYTELDQVKRQEYYDEIQEILREDLPWIPLRCGEIIYGIRSTLTGMEREPQSKPMLKFVRPK